MRSGKKVLITGAGIGGLTTALRLAKKGYQVEIIEKNSQAGGRLNQIKTGGFTFDTGPSFFSMSYEFEEFARDCNIDVPFKFIKLDPLYAVNIKDDPTTYFLYRDIRKLAGQFSDIEPDFEEKMEKYLKKSGQIFHDTVGIVIKSNFDSLFDYVTALMRVNPAHLPVLSRTFYQQVKLYFSSWQVRQIISLVAFFLGRTPFDTMGIYTLLSYTEFRHDGYYNVEGGMYAIVEGLVRELEKENVKIIYNTEITGYAGSNGRLEALIDSEGKRWHADIFVSNADAALFRGSVLKRRKYSPERLDRKSWTMGYLTIYLGLNFKLPGIHHHHYFLGTNFEEYSGNVMKNPTILQKPYYYVNLMSANNPDCAPPGCESLFIVCPVPNLMYKPDWQDAGDIADSIIRDLGERTGRDIFPGIVSRTVYTPLDWQEKFNLYRGSGLGLSHNMSQIGALRPANFDEEFRNLFYVGASTVPGAGLPMSIIGSKLAVERILKI